MTELWFDDQAEDAARYYVETFPNSELGNIYHYATDTPSGKPEGSVMTTINGQRFQALNGGPFFTLNEATSFVIQCETEDEQDYIWEMLTQKKLDVAAILKAAES